MSTSLKPILLVEDNPKDLELTLIALEKSQLANEVVRILGAHGEVHPAGDVSDLVRAEIQRRGISIYAAAQEMGIVRQRLHQLLRGEVTPSRAVLVKLAEWAKRSRKGC